MGLFRRRRTEPALEDARARFAVVAGHVEAAQRALLASIPTARDEGVPLAQAIAEMTRRLDAADRGMDAWRDDSVAHEWTKCADALRRARAEVERLRLEPGELGFEALNVRVGDVLHPLETFADVERDLRRR